jgi:hypothetical protein
VDDVRSRVVILGLGDPHKLESGERGKDRATDPHRVLALSGGNDLDLHGRRSKLVKLLGHALGNTGEHSGTTRKDNVEVEITTDIDITLHYGLESALVDADSLLANDRGLEKYLRTTEALITEGDDGTIGKLVGHLELRRELRSLHLLVKVHAHVSELLLDVADNLALGGGNERVTTLGEDSHEVIGQIATGKVKTDNSVGKSVTLKDGHGVRNAITRVKHATGSTTRGIQRKNGLDVDVHGGDVEGLEHDLSHELLVLLRVEGSLSKEDGVLIGGNTKFVVEGMVPDLLHIVPVAHNTVLNGVLKGKDTTLGLGLVSYIGVLLVHANHDSGVLGAAHNRREHSAGGIIAGKTGLAHAGTVVDN